MFLFKIQQLKGKRAQARRIRGRSQSALGAPVGTKDAGQDGDVDVMPGKRDGAPGTTFHLSAASRRVISAEPPRSQPALSDF